MKSHRPFSRVVEDMPADCPGLAHALDLLLLALARGPMSPGAVMDEFTAMHADRVEQLKALAMESPDQVPVLEAFMRASRAIYKRLSRMDAEHSAALRAQCEQTLMMGSQRLH